MPTVGTLLADAALGLARVAGPDDDRQIRAAAVSELTSPGPWLRGGELLMTIGLLLEMSERSCQDYVEGLVSAGVAALAVGLGADLPHQTAPAELVAAADRVGLPLLTVPDRVPFIAVTNAVYAHLAAQERRELQWAFETQRALTAAAVQPGGLSAILEAHRRASDCTGVVIDLLGRVLAAAGPDVETLAAHLHDVVETVRRGGLHATGVDTDAQVRREVHPLGSARVRGWLLIEGRADRVASQAVTAGLVSLLSLEIERRYTLDAAERRLRARVFDRLARATIDDLAAGRLLASVGLTTQDLCCAAIAEDDADGLAADLAAVLPDALVRPVGDVVHVAVPGSVDLRKALGRVASGRPTGIGTGVRPGALAVSLRQATSALAASRLSNEVVVATDVASSRLILSGIPAGILHTYVDAVLGPLDASEQRQQLLATLSTFLESNGVWDVAAHALHVHRHTMRNRIARIEHLTGKRLDTAEDRFELWLAVRLRDLAHAEGAPDVTATRINPTSSGRK